VGKIDKYRKGKGRMVGQPREDRKKPLPGKSQEWGAAEKGTGNNRSLGAASGEGNNKGRGSQSKTTRSKGPEPNFFSIAKRDGRTESKKRKKRFQRGKKGRGQENLKRVERTQTRRVWTFLGGRESLPRLHWHTTEGWSLIIHDGLVVN